MDPFIDHSSITLDLINLLEYLDSPDKLSQIQPLCTSLISRLNEIFSRVSQLPGTSEEGSTNLDVLREKAAKMQAEATRTREAFERFKAELQDVNSM